MIIHTTTYEATQAAETVDKVRCEKCDCVYYYQKRRLGVGRSVRLYGFIGKSNNSANQQANDEVARRLETESDPVPCPKCHWINEQLVDGYRRTRYRSLTSWGIWLFSFGTLISLIVAYVLSVGAVQDRVYIPYVLIVGPFTSALLAGICFGAQWLLRKLTNPNHRYPQKPILPFGVPQALLLDPTSNQLVPHEKGRESDDEADDPWIIVPMTQVVVPVACFCCNAKEQLTIDPVASQSGLPIMKCTPCRRQQRNRKVLFVLVGLLLSATIGAFVIRLADEVGYVIYGSVILVSALVMLVLASLFDPTVDVSMIDRDRGIMRLGFSNPEFRWRVRKAIRQAGKRS